MSDLFSLWGTLFLVFLLLALKGSVGEGQPTLFSNFIEEYVEETSAAFTSYADPPAQLADISTLIAASTDNLGQGGENTAITPAPINDNSLTAHNPISTDYIETGESTRSQVVEYIVQPGDLLSFIASDFGVSVASIIWANQLRNADSISPGQILKIPPVSGVIHTVVKNDTVSLIAKKYSVDADEIIAFNSLPRSGDLRIGDDIIVPDGIIKGSTATTSTSSSIARSFSYLTDLGDYFMIPTSGYNWGRIHGRNGVDIANSCGTPIYAAAEGSVALADGVGYNGGFGKYIKIIHPNGTETLYAHATKLLISAGEYAQRGQMIALMGSTGRSTGCHLHFEVHGARNPLVK
jgi:LysM repeat protein